jgi:hypothetical protein
MLVCLAYLAPTYRTVLGNVAGGGRWHMAGTLLTLKPAHGHVAAGAQGRLNQEALLTNTPYVLCV